MKPKIHIWATNIGRCTQDIRVMFGNITLAEAGDIDYESTDASKCCELLVGMRKAGIIELTADEAAVKQWPALANRPRSGTPTEHQITFTTVNNTKSTSIFRRVTSVGVLCIALLGVFFFSGCSAQTRAKSADFSRITRDGHSYVVFEIAGKYGASVLHDPDCKCRASE